MSNRSSVLQLDALALKRIIVLFWALYFSFVVATNVGDGMKALGIVSEGWVFASGNSSMIAKVVSIYGVPAWIAGAMFACVILWEMFIAVQFWNLFRNPSDLQTPGRPKAVRAFGSGIILWSIFVLSDELFIAYDEFGGIEGAHLGLLSAQILTFLVVYLIDEKG